MKKHLAVFIIFPILIVILTYPLIFKINSYIPGFFSTDEVYGSIWHAWWAKASFLDKSSITHISSIAYPFGIDFTLSKQIIGFFWFFVFSLIAILTNHVLTYNIQVIFNFFFSSIFTYLLVYYLTKNKLCSLLSGIIFAFSPYIFAHSWQHLGETYLWQMPLFLWMLFRLKDDKRLRIKIAFIVSYLLTLLNLDVFYYTSIIFGIFLVYSIKGWKKNKMHIKRIVGLMAVAFIILTPQVFIVFKNLIIGRQRQNEASAFNTYNRPFDDLFMQSARPLSYVVPPPAHPLLGGFAKQLIGSSLYGDSFTEHTLYLGFTPLILAFLVFRRWRKIRRLRAINDDNYYIGFFLLLTLAAWLFSQPPWWKIGPVKIFMPSFFMYKILPPFRAYCRFGIVVMLAIAVLAGYGLRYILERFKTSGRKVLTTSLLCGIVLFEFWNYPPFKVIDVSKAPQAYYWLKEMPGEFAVAEYPLDIDLPNEMYKFYQVFHHKPIINGTIPGTEPNMIARTITDLSDSLTASKLKGLGVKYVFVHQDHYLNTELLKKKKELEGISSNPGLKFVKTFSPQNCPVGAKCAYKSGQIDVYEVVAAPVIPDEILNNKVLRSKIRTAR